MSHKPNLALISENELNAIEERLSKIGPEPWKSFVEGRDFTSGSSCVTVGADGERAYDIELLGATPDDQDFIAAARQDVPRLIAEVRRLQSMLKIDQ